MPEDVRATRPQASLQAGTGRGPALRRDPAASAPGVGRPRTRVRGSRTRVAARVVYITLGRWLDA